MKKAIFFLLGVFAYIGVQSQTTLTEAVDFTIKDVNGVSYHLFDILDNRNQYVLLDFYSVT